MLFSSQLFAQAYCHSSHATRFSLRVGLPIHASSSPYRSRQVSPLLFSFIYISSGNDFLWPPPFNPWRHLPFNFLNQHSTEILHLNFLTSLLISGLPITFMFQLLSIPIFTYVLFLSRLFAHFFLFIPLYLCANWPASFTSFLGSHPYQILTGKGLLSVFNLCPPLPFLLFFLVLGLNRGTCACKANVLLLSYTPGFSCRYIFKHHFLTGLYV